MQLIEKFKQYPLRQGDGFIREVLTVAWPMVLQQLLTCSVTLLDNLMVGQLGDMEISGVAVASKFLMVAQYAVFGIAAASGVYIAQYHGAKKKEEVHQSYRFSFVVSLLIAVLFAVPAILAPGSIGRFFTADTGIQDPIKSYLPTAAAAMVVQVFSLTSQNAMRCMGETRLPLFLSSVAVVGNTVFNYIFIFGHLGVPAMGVYGAALGTLCARALEMLVTAWVSFRHEAQLVQALFRFWDIPKKLAIGISKRALPLCVNEIGFGSGMAMVFKFYGTRGGEVLAAMNIMGTVSELFFVLFSGMAIATTVVVGQALGANELEKARSNAYRLYQLSMIIGVFFTFLMFLSSFIFPQFYNVSEEVRGMAIYFIRVYSFFYLIYTSNAAAYFVLRAGGDSKNTLKMDAGWFWFVNIPIVAAAAYFTDWNVTVLFFIGQMTDFFKSFIAMPMLVKETWLRNLTAEN